MSSHLPSFSPLPAPALQEGRREQSLSEQFVQKGLVRPGADALGYQVCDWLLTPFPHSISLSAEPGAWDSWQKGRGKLGGPPRPVAAQPKEV